MKLNLDNRNSVNIDENKTVLVGKGYEENYYFVLYETTVYFCAQQEGELFIRHYVCDEADCGIKFPCYD